MNEQEALAEIQRQLTEISTRLAKISVRQKATAQSVADIALGLNVETRASRDRDSEVQALILGMLAESRRPERKRRDSEDTSNFRLPGGDDGDNVQLTKRTQRKIVRWVVLGFVAVLLHVAQFLLHGYMAIRGGGH